MYLGHHASSRGYSCHHEVYHERSVASARSLADLIATLGASDLPERKGLPTRFPQHRLRGLKSAQSISRVADGWQCRAASVINRRPPGANAATTSSLIKATWPYSVQEIADLFGIRKNAVLRWLTEGLRADRGQRPFLIRGDELTRFLKARQDGTRHRCAPCEFFCFKCRGPREAYLGMADIVIESATRLRLKALCGTCDTLVNKVQSVRDLEKIQSRFHVQQLTGEHLLECSAPSVNRDLER